MQISPCNLRSGGCIPALPEPGKFAGCSPGYTCILLNVPPANQQGDYFDRRNDDGQICKFPLSIPGLGIEFRLRRNREIRVLIPWIHFHFTQCSPCEKQADIISAIDIVKHSPLWFRRGICIYRRNIGDKRSNFPLQPPEWRLHSGFAGTGKIRRLLSWIHLHLSPEQRR